MLEPNGAHTCRGLGRLPRPAPLLFVALHLTLLGCLSWTAAAAEPTEPALSTGANSKGEASALSYGRDVRPILSDRCFQCHGADGATREADLRLDRREDAVGGSSPVIVPGDAEASELWRRLTTHDADDVMPPARAKKRPLSADELDVMRRWIDAGAEYESHWAFAAPTRPALPEVQAPDWCEDPIDRFVLAQLEASDVAPSPQADSATLARRVFLDLTGLPPTGEELDFFLSDVTASGTSAALGRLVDRLLTAEPYRSRMGESFAVWWMDAARYADTSGIHTDNGRQMWHWRDWVIEAFRSNMPFDRFVTEQLAGDLLPDATLEQKIASGFNRNHVTTDEGGAIAEEYLIEYAIDRVETTSTVFLGLTAGCARCHDHKYDPLTQEDFYGLVGFFNSVDEPGLYSQTPDPNRAYEPFLEVPSREQIARLGAIDRRRGELSAALEKELPEEEEHYAAFLGGTRQAAGVAWSTPEVVDARSSEEGVVLEIQEDRSVLVSGPLPESEDYTIELRTDASDQRVLLLEALATPNPDPDSKTPDGAGRASHGNAVLSQVALQTRATGEEEWSSVPLSWAWSDHVQENGDFQAGNVLDPDRIGWAVDGNENSGARTLLLLADRPFGAEAGSGGGAELRVTLAFRSPYGQHSLGRVRLRTASLTSTETLPVQLGRWYRCGPFPMEGASRGELYAAGLGPEAITRLDPKQTFGDEELGWVFDRALVDGAPVTLEGGVGVTYLARNIWSPEDREVRLHLGSDDGFSIRLNGELIVQKQVDRGAANDQDQLTLQLAEGLNTLVFEIVNTGGPAGYAFRVEEPATVLTGELPSALLENDAVPSEQAPELRSAWRRRFFEGYRVLDDERLALEAEATEIQASVPRAMVMQELDEPRPSYVLLRGEYDHPDESRPVPRRTPSFLTPLPDDAPRDRLGLAQWLTGPDNALFARVAVNRFWQQLFGKGLVRTSEDFGLQGEWPTHPELLDWLAVEFRESGWDVHGLLRRIVLSSTYRQSSRVRTELAAEDPDNRRLAHYPRRRLSAEQIRDLALYTSGLLVERVGGQSVKPYQPDGLWKEVAMLSSNTREFELGQGDELWRRSLYTYWKRAVPPPSLQTFDAPTRESCVVRRQSTNTPLQALVLWNDVQFVEAARELAGRARTAEQNAGERIAWLFRTTTARWPDDEESQLLLDLLSHAQARFADEPAEARALLDVGQSAHGAQADDEAIELAAWTLVASSILNIHETLTQD